MFPGGRVGAEEAASQAPAVSRQKGQVVGGVEKEREEYPVGRAFPKQKEQTKDTEPNHLPRKCQL